jgi:hypothetical protein
MEPQPYSSRDIKLAIMSMPAFSQKLIGVGKPYENLLQAILAIDRDPQKPMPTDKAIMAEHNIKSHHYRIWLNQIYADLLEMMSDFDHPQFEIKKITHHISWSKRDKSFYLVTSLPETPRIGSRFEMDFFNPISGRFGIYYVENITYLLKDGEMIVGIHLRSGFLNRYSMFEEEKQEYEAYKKGIWHWGRWREKKREELNQH